FFREIHNSFKLVVSQSELLDYVLPVLLLQVCRISFVLELSQSLVPSDFARADETGQVRLSFIESEFFGKNVSLIKPRVDALVMLPAVVLPIQLLLQHNHRIFFDVVKVIEDFDSPRFAVPAQVI